MLTVMASMALLMCHALGMTPIVAAWHICIHHQANANNLLLWL